MAGVVAGMGGAVTVKGPHGEAMVYTHGGHVWQVQFWPTWRGTRKHRRAVKPQHFEFKGAGAKGVAVLRAKQLTGAFT